MPKTHYATVTINTSGFDSNVDPNPLVVTAGDTIVWKPVGGTINFFLFHDDSVFSKVPEKLKSAENWEAIIKTGIETDNDNYGVNVTTENGTTFKIDPQLEVNQ